MHRVRAASPANHRPKFPGKKPRWSSGENGSGAPTKVERGSSRRAWGPCQPTVVEEVTNDRRRANPGVRRVGPNPSGRTISVQECREPPRRAAGENKLGGFVHAMGERPLNGGVKILDAAKRKVASAGHRPHVGTIPAKTGTVTVAGGHPHRQPSGNERKSARHAGARGGSWLGPSFERPPGRSGAQLLG